MIKFLLYIGNLRGVFEMKEVIKTIAAVSMFALLASCQMNTADDGNQNENPSSETTSEYTVSFDLNYPEDTDEYMFCDDLLVAPIAADTGDERDVYLPTASKWADFFTGEEIEVPENGIIHVNTKNIPVYKRIG